MEQYLLTIMIGYLLGSINVAYIIGKAKGIDIREKGSKNAGASNVKVNFGWKYAILTALLDMFKAFIAVIISRHLFPDNEIIPFLAGAMAILGHIFPFYMKFKGGKGFAAYIGMMFAIDYRIALVIILLTAIITLITNYIALATLATATITPAYYIYTKANIYIIAILIVIMLIIFFKHRINIIRIIRHEEIGLRQKRKIR